MTETVEVALIAAGGSIVSGTIGIALAFMLKRLEVKVDGRLTELLKATNAQGRQDERDSRSITVEGVPAHPREGSGDKS